MDEGNAGDGWTDGGAVGGWPSERAGCAKRAAEEVGEKGKN